MRYDDEGNRLPFEVGTVLGDMCDSGRKVPRVIDGEKYVLTSYTQINMDDGPADEIVKAFLRGVGEPDNHYINKFAVVVDVRGKSYTAMYSYDYNFSIFTFDEVTT